MLVEQRRSLLDLAGAGLNAAVVELAADYQGDPELANAGSAAPSATRSSRTGAR